MAEQKSDAERWRELADMLGLPADEPAPRVTPRSPAPAAPTRPIDESLAGSEELPREETLEAPTRQSEPHTEEPHAGPREWAGMTDDVPEATVGEVEPGASSEEDDRPRRGRKRGRRGRRGRDEDRDSPEQAREEGGRRRRAEPAAAEPAAAERDDVEPDEIGPGDSPEELASDDADRDDNIDENEELVEVEDTSPAASEDEEDDTEIDRLKDWNVPSWNDLIASLYRPER